MIEKEEVTVHLIMFSGFDFARSNDERLVLESLEIKRYSLKQLSLYFNELMKDELYAKDVTELLAGAKRNREYLVTGFYTTCGATWKRSQLRLLQSLRVYHFLNYSIQVSTPPSRQSKDMIRPGKS